METKTMINDLTTGSVSKKLLAFSAPIILSNILQTAYNMVDMIIVGQFVGSVGLSAVSIGSDILHFLTFLAMGLANAGQVIISQFVGSGDEKSVSRTVGTMFTVLTVVAVVVAIICFIGVDVFLNALNTPPEAFDYAKSYAITCFCGLFFIYGYNLISAVLRGMGDSTRPMIFIAIAAVSNLLLDLLFVAVFKWAVFGAALATVLGQAFSFIASIIYLFRRKEAFGFDFKPASFKPDSFVLKQLLKLGLPMCLQSMAINISMMFVSSNVNAYGIVASAVTGVGNKIGNMTAIIASALSTAGGAMIGQCLGAGKQERVPQIIKISLIIDLCFAAVLTVAMVLFPRQIFGIFNSDPEILDMAMTYVLCAVIQFFGFALRSPFFALINGVGHAKLNLAVGLLDGVVCRVGLAILLGSVFGMGIQGYWYGNALAGYVPFIIGCAYYLSGRWKTRKLVIAE